MLKPSWGVLRFIFIMLAAVSLSAPACAADEVFVVSSSYNGDAYFMSSYGDGTFSSQEVLELIENTDIDLPYPYSYGNGLGDFDGDGDLDYIMGVGYGTGNIYIYEKLDAGNNFAPPYFVDTWGFNGGYYSMDFAVADFDEDGITDFVLSLNYSSTAELYLGDGYFNFENKQLPEASPYASAGADAADFNNDGHADFVIAPFSNEEFFVNIGDGEGNFTTHKFASYDSGALYGVAAADFDGDGNADIAAAYFDNLYLYKGAGDGMTFSYMASYPLSLNMSAIDNYDFDDDGDQDLVVASYGNDQTGVAVLLNNGDGTFAYDDTYLGGAGWPRNAVSGPPWEPKSNVEPVAVIEPATIEAIAGEEVIFDGSYSFDEDGQIVSYDWDFGDVQAAPAVMSALSVDDAGGMAEGANPSHTYHEAGNYIVTLWVTDDAGSTTSTQAQVQVNDAPRVDVSVRFAPRILYLNSKGIYVWAKVVFPSGYDALNVDDSSIEVVTEDGVSLPTHVRKSRFWDRIFRKFKIRKRFIMLKFDRQALLASLGCPPAGRVALTVKGKVSRDQQWAEFSGTNSIGIRMRKHSVCPNDDTGLQEPRAEAHPAIHVFK